MDEPTTFAAIFRDKRILRGQSQAAAARELGLTRAAVSLWEQGRTIPADPQWAKVAEYLGFSDWRALEALLKESTCGR